MPGKDNIGKIAVIGAGNMGAAIAEVLAFNGYEVLLKDVNSDLINAGMKRIESFASSLMKFEASRAQREITRIEKLGIELTQAQKAAILEKNKPLFTEGDLKTLTSRVRPVLEYAELKDADLIIEAVFENLEIKREVFRQVAEVVREDAVIASNTSSISITSISSGIRGPERILITHFFNPPYTLPLVEIVPSLVTDASVVERIRQFMSGLRNHRGSLLPILAKESPGFVVNRMLVPMINEGIFLLDEGVASKEDIDLAMKKGAGMPMGPLELADMVGLDVTLDVCNLFYEQYGDQKYRPSVLLKRMVDAGYLGKKSGRGFYSY